MFLLPWARVSGRICNIAVMGFVVDVVKHPKYVHMATTHLPDNRNVRVCRIAPLKCGCKSAQVRNNFLTMGLIELMQNNRY